jgi:hypothetical protein
LEFWRNIRKIGRVENFITAKKRQKF